MHRAAVSWLLVFVFLVAGFGASVAALNNTVYSAHGFVQAYLEALARHDAAEALSFDGVEVPREQDDRLLTDDALGYLGDIQFQGDAASGDTHHVTFSYALHSSPTISARPQTTFDVERVGTRLGMFPTWRFAKSPLASIIVSSPSEATFTANGVDVTAAADGSAFVVLVPGSYRLDHESEYLTAPDLAVPVTEVGSESPAEVDVKPTDAFEADAEKAVASYLDACAEQQVLMPTGCPFGFPEANRVVGLPQWSIADYPSTTITTATTQGTWLTVGVGGAAHIEMKVRSLFDGSVSTVDDDVPFEGSYLVTITDDGGLTVALAP
jgi:hypothetical protein